MRVCVGQRSTLSAIFEVLFTLGFETGSLIDPELTIKPSSLRDYSVSTASVLGSQACSTISGFFFFFNVDPGYQTQVLMLMQ